jgi:signal transduction histidine kinase
MGSPVLLSNEDGNILYYNDNWKKLFECECELSDFYINNNINDIILVNSDIGLNTNIIKCISLSGTIFYSEIKKYDISIDGVSSMFIYIFSVKSLDETSQYQLFFNICNEMLCIVNNEGSFLKVNRSFNKVLGHITESENQNCSYINMKKFIDYVHVSDRNDTLEKLNQLKIANNGDTFQFINRYKMAITEEYKYISWKCFHLDDMIYMVASDITKQYINEKKILENETTLEDAERLASLGCWKWDLKSDKILWSDGLRDIYEMYDINLIDFKKFISLNFIDDREMIKKVFENCIEMKNSFEITYRLKMACDKVKYIYARGKFVEDIEGAYIMGVVQDITKQKLIELELIGAKIIAEKTSVMKTAFVANMSHEIRTPINSIIGTTSLLKKTGLNDEQMDFLDTIISSSGVLLSIINNILDFSKIESGKVSVNNTEVILAKLLSYIREIFERVISNKGILFKIHVSNDVPDSIICDIVKIQQIISNLINNSIKFTEHGSIMLIISIEKIDNHEFLKFEIRDTGVGISTKDQKELFNPFAQIDNAITRKHGGNGLGLSICKNLIDAMSGDMGLISSEKIGTNVWFTIPYKV